jgi:hypothetical protein
MAFVYVAPLSFEAPEPMSSTNGELSNIFIAIRQLLRSLPIRLTLHEFAFVYQLTTPQLRYKSALAFWHTLEKDTDICVLPRLEAALSVHLARAPLTFVAAAIRPNAAALTVRHIALQLANKISTI